MLGAARPSWPSWLPLWPWRTDTRPVSWRPRRSLRNSISGTSLALAGPLGITVVLLTGSLKKKAKESVLADIASGASQIVIGTHALIEEGVQFNRLGLAIIDEQHRFGVMQRSTLKSKGYEPDVLVMTATPIPRTLALTVYGDLDVSVIDEMPPGRSPIITRLYFESRRREAYQLMESELAKGTGRSTWSIPWSRRRRRATSRPRPRWRPISRRTSFPRWKVGLLHGRMKGEEKEAVMAAFKTGASPYPGLDHGHRGRRGRAERDGHGHRASRALRPGPAPPAPRQGGERQPTSPTAS